jgi:hypothetical protein
MMRICFRASRVLARNLDARDCAILALRITEGKLSFPCVVSITLRLEHYIVSAQIIGTDYSISNLGFSKFDTSSFDH